MKSVLGEFSFGVSICCYKGTQSDLGAPFLSGPPDAGGKGGRSSGSAYIAALCMCHSCRIREVVQSVSHELCLLIGQHASNG